MRASFIFPAMLMVHMWTDSAAVTIVSESASLQVVRENEPLSLYCDSSVPYMWCYFAHNLTEYPTTAKTPNGEAFGGFFSWNKNNTVCGLHVENAQVGHAGTWKCHLANTDGASAQVSDEKYMDVFVATPSNVNLIAPSNLTFSYNEAFEVGCETTTMGSPPPTVELFIISPNNLHRRLESGTNFTVHYTPDIQDVGSTFRCTWSQEKMDSEGNNILLYDGQVTTDSQLEIVIVPQIMDDTQKYYEYDRSIGEVVIPVSFMARPWHSCMKSIKWSVVTEDQNLIPLSNTTLEFTVLGPNGELVESSITPDIEEDIETFVEPAEGSQVAEATEAEVDEADPHHDSQDQLEVEEGENKIENEAEAESESEAESEADTEDEIEDFEADYEHVMEYYPLDESTLLPIVVAESEDAEVEYIYSTTLVLRNLTDNVTLALELSSAGGSGYLRLNVEVPPLPTTPPPPPPILISSTFITTDADTVADTDAGTDAATDADTTTYGLFSTLVSTTTRTVLFTPGAVGGLVAGILFGLLLLALAFYLCRPKDRHIRDKDDDIDEEGMWTGKRQPLLPQSAHQLNHRMSNSSRNNINLADLNAKVPGDDMGGKNSDGGAMEQFPSAPLSQQLTMSTFGKEPKNQSLALVSRPDDAPDVVDSVGKPLTTDFDLVHSPTSSMSTDDLSSMGVKLSDFPDIAHSLENLELLSKSAFMSDRAPKTSTIKSNGSEVRVTGPTGYLVQMPTSPIQSPSKQLHLHIPYNNQRNFAKD